MLKAELITDKNLIFAIINSRDLKVAISGELKDSGHIPVRSDTFYIGLFKDDDLCILAPIKVITNSLIEGHIYTLPHHDGEKIYKELQQPYFDFLRDNTKQSTIMTYIPRPCIRSIKAAEFMGFKKSGKIKNGINYFNKEADLLIFSKRFRSK